MATKKEATNPATTSFAYDTMLPKWDRISTLLGGTDAMREAGQTYLPQHDQESAANYRDRLMTATLYNMLELTLDTLVGKPFSLPITLKEDVPQKLRDYAEDIDLQGNNVTVFSREVFREAMAKAFCHVLVDFPTLSDEERAGRTREDDMREGRRPYWVMIKPENVIAMHSETINGVEVLTHVRIYEELIERNGFAEEIVEQIRVLEPGAYEIWKKIKPKKGGKAVWRIVDGGTTGLDFVPLFTYYTNRTGLMMGKPPLDDLSHLNVRHWQSTADQINILTVARFPMLAVSGATDQTGQTMAIGPRQMLGTKDPQGRFYYVEHKGQAIEAGRQDLLDLEEMMAAYGAEFLKRRPGNATATARALDSSESISMLQDAAIRFQDFLELLLWATAAWEGGDEGGSVHVNSDFKTHVNPAALKLLLESRANGDISREDFLEELKRMGILSDDFDPTKNLMRLMAEVALAGVDLSLVNPKDVRGGEKQPKSGESEEDDDDETDS